MRQPQVAQQPPQHGGPIVGGPNPNPAPAQPVGTTSVTLTADLTAAKKILDEKIRALNDDPIADAINKKIEEANKALHTFSQGALVEQIKEQNEKLTTDITTRANIDDSDRREAFAAALKAYLDLRMELARVRLQELDQKEQQAEEAQQYILSQFQAPGVPDNDPNERGKIISKLGDSHSHITRTEGLIFKSNIIVTYENGILSSDSPKDLAMTAKAMGWNEFEFNMGSTKNGGKILKDSIREMLKIGIKDITLSKELREQMYASRRASNLADALVENMHTLNKYQKEELEQLERICSASRAAYKSSRKNTVFDADGNLNSDEAAKREAVEHRIDTFMNLTNDEDRIAYIDIIFPEEKARNCADFAKALERREPKIEFDIIKFRLLPTKVSPREYIERQILRPRLTTDVFAEKNEFRTRIKFLDQKEELDKFNKASTTFDQRKTAYLASEDAKLLAALAQSDKLSNAERSALVKAVFADSQTQAAATHPISLKRDPIFLTYDVDKEDKKKFLHKALPLFNEMQPAAEPADSQALLQHYALRSQLIADLRTDAQRIFAEEKAANNPAAFENFNKNKILLDDLEEKVLLDQFPHLSQKLISEAVPNAENEAHSRLLAQHTAAYRSLAFNSPEKASRFVRDFSPLVQQYIWKNLSPHSQTSAQLRAKILKEYIDTYVAANNPAAEQFLKTAIKPLLRHMTAEEVNSMTTELGKLCQEQGVHGCTPKQNHALSIIRDNIAALGPEFKAQRDELLTTKLFEKYYNTAQVVNPPIEVELYRNNIINSTEARANKLLERIQCYTSVTPSRTLNNKFDEEMRNLLFSRNFPTPNDQLQEILQHLDVDNRPQEEQQFIKRIGGLQPSREKAATQQPVEQELQDLSRHDFDV